MLLFFTGLVSGQDFSVENYTVDINLNPDYSFDVIEKYDIDFKIPKHGLIRKIIAQYDFTDSNGAIENRKIQFSDIEVPGNNFTVTPKIVCEMGGDLEIKIGNAPKTVIGNQNYEISYKVKNALIVEDSLVLLYWNLKPADWDADFKKIKFNIQLPEGSVISAENCFTYSGDNENSEVSNEFDYDFSNRTYSAVSHPDFNSAQGQSVTVLIKLDKKLFSEASPPLIDKSEYGWMAILAGFSGLFGLVWLIFGRDRKTISFTSYYPPKGIDPAMAGYLIDDREDTSDLISLLPKWGADGLISIEEIPKKNSIGKTDIRLSRLGTISADAPSYEKTMFNGLWGGFSIDGFPQIAEVLKMFSPNIDLNSVKSELETSTKTDTVLMSSLQKTFYYNMISAKSQLKKSGMKFYEVSGEKAKILTAGAGFLLTFAGTGYFVFKYGIIAGIAAFIVFLFISLMSSYMRKKNHQGDRILSELKGFRQFIKLAEVERIKTLLKDDPKYFEKTMSYALAFGLLDEWASKFDGLDVPQPQWYSGTSSTKMSSGFSGTSFVHSFKGAMSAASYAMVSSPSGSGSGSGSGSSSGFRSSGSSHSSGGGHSGGGFGGGGGKSW